MEPWALYSELAALNQKGLHSKVLAEIDEAIASPATSTAATVLKADALWQIGSKDEAVQLLEATSDSKNPWVPYNLAHFYRELGRRPEAASQYRECHALMGWPESKKNGYTFTHDYFSGNIENWSKWFAEIITAEPIKCLEIGSWQGGSATWLLDKVVGPRGGSLTCIDPFTGSSEHAPWIESIGSIEQIFDGNVKKTGHGKRCKKLKGYSTDVLPTLAGQVYDFLYIDGAHEADIVIQDARLCWALTRVGSFILFDDADFQFYDRPDQNTANAIAAFKQEFAGRFETMYEGRQLLVKRTA